MPKKEIDYKKAMIYKICCNDLKVKDIYVGSTTEFTKRKCAHKSRCNVEMPKYLLYNCIRNNGGWENWSMILIEKYPCNDNIELRARERYYVEALNANLNSQIPIITKQEKQKAMIKYRINNREYYIKYNKEYRIDNKEYTKKYRKEYQNKNKHFICRREICECGVSIQVHNKIRHLKSKIHKTLLSNPFINFEL